MGFSVSGSAAIVFAGMFLAFGTFYAASSNSFERVGDAQKDRSDEVLAADNSDIAIRSTERDGDRLTVLVNNTGSTALSVEETDFLVDNEYQTGWVADARVNGATDTDLWLPGEQLNITVRTSDVPSRVKVVSEHGVADTEVVG